MMGDAGTMLTQMQKILRASPTAIIVEVAMPDACIEGKQNYHCVPLWALCTSWAIALGGVATGSMKA